MKSAADQIPAQTSEVTAMRSTRNVHVSLVMAALTLAPALCRSLPADEPAKTSENAKDAGAAKAAESLKPVVAVIRLKGSLLETPQDETLPLASERATSLKDVIERFQKARDDKAVKAVVLTINELELGSWAQIEELRQAIEQVRQGGKEVYA